MVEENVYCGLNTGRDIRDSLDPEPCEEKGSEEPGALAGGPKEGGVAKMVGLYGEGQLGKRRA